MTFSAWFARHFGPRHSVVPLANGKAHAAPVAVDVDRLAREAAYARELRDRAQRRLETSFSEMSTSWLHLSKTLEADEKVAELDRLLKGK